MDPICTFVFAGLVLLTTRAILRDISDILMERVPRSQDADSLQAGLQEVLSHHSSFLSLAHEQAGRQQSCVPGCRRCRAWSSRCLYLRLPALFPST